MMPGSTEEALRASPLFGRLAPEDVARLAAVTRTRTYEKDATIFSEGEPSDWLFSIASGRVKVVKLLPSGKEVILEIFSAGDPLGAVVAFEGRPYPASAVALEPTVCTIVGRREFFALLESQPTLLRGYLVGLTQRIVELTRRIPEVAGARVETRFARLFLKLAEKMGEARPEGTAIPMTLSRQDLADLTGTTLESGIRLMSRWAREEVVRTDRDGFVILDRAALERLASA